jgi:AcrR family transcriptional regulator
MPGPGNSRDAARRMRREALEKANEVRRKALADAKDKRKRALADAKEARRAMRTQVEESIARGFEPLTPDRRRAMTRQHLLEAAARIFARDGFHGASLDDIAATAGFTKGAVYSNFKSKEDLLLALMDKHMTEQFDEIVGSLETEDRTQEQQLPSIARTVTNHMWDDSWSMLWLEFVLYAARNPDARSKIKTLMRKSRQQVVDIIEKEYAHTGEDPKYSSEQVAIITTAMFDGLGMYHLVDPDVANDETIRTLLQLLYDAMGVDDTGEAEAGNSAG